MGKIKDPMLQIIITNTVFICMWVKFSRFGSTERGEKFSSTNISALFVINIQAPSSHPIDTFISKGNGIVLS